MAAASQRECEAWGLTENFWSCADVGALSVSPQRPLALAKGTLDTCLWASCPGLGAQLGPSPPRGSSVHTPQHPQEMGDHLPG